MQHINPMTYQTLKPGDVRKLGDEQRKIIMITPYGGYCLDIGKTHKKGFSSWRPACLLGHAILLSDLCHLEFRRPV